MELYRTVEVRWFRLGEIPGEVEAWFDGLGPAIQTESRVDRYLAPTDDALGVKLRNHAIEAKRRTARLAPIRVGACQATAEAWTKWSFALATPGDTPRTGWVEVDKHRRQRFVGGVALELSRLEVRGEVWWSVCVEARGAGSEVALVAAVRQWLAVQGAPALAEADAMSYPAWLRARETGE